MQEYYRTSRHLHCSSGIGIEPLYSNVTSNLDIRFVSTGLQNAMDIRTEAWWQCEALYICQLGTGANTTRWWLFAKNIFSEEASFHIGGFVNKHSFRIWAAENPRTIVEKPLLPQKVPVWCASSANETTGLYLLENDADSSVMVTGERYSAMINNFLGPEEC